MKRTIIILCLLNLSLLFSQSKIDSLLQIVSTTKDDSLKVMVYLKLYYEYHRTDQNIALEYTTKAEALAEKAGLEFGLGQSKFRKGSVLQSIGLYKEAEENFNEALSIFIKLDDVSNIVFVKIEMARLLQSQLKLEEAIILYLEILPLTKKSGDKNAEARIHNYLGSLYNIQKQYNKAIEHFEFALVLVKALDFKPGISSCLTNLGNLYMLTENYIKAMPYLEEALLLKTENGDKLGASRVLYYFGKLYSNKEEYDLAEQKYLQAYELAKEVNNQKHLTTVVFGLAENAYKLGNYERSIYLCNSILDNTALPPHLELAFNTHGLLSDSYGKIGEFKKAYTNAIIHNKLSDSLYNEKILEVTNNLDAKYHNEQNAKDNELLMSKNDLQSLQLQKRINERNVIIALVIILIGIAGMLFYLFRVKQKTNTKLKELDKAKSNFFTNISHEFRTPLTLISGPIQKQLKDQDLNEEQRTNLEMMQRNADRLLSLVDQLLDISKIETGRLQLKISKHEILPFIGTLADGFTFTARQNQITYSTNINTTTADTWFDKDALEKIVINLVSNAIKYTPANGKIECSASVINSKLHFEIKNTGKGLSKDEINKIFERFYQVNEDKQGVGIGLALVKELVTLHKGIITVESTPYEWTIFKVILPIDKLSYNDSEICKETSEGLNQKQSTVLQSSKTIETEESQALDEDKALLLIVDDNADIRTYVSSIFKNEFTILQAENGKEGIAIAIKHIPDIIISDVMMPIKNGIELCNALKTDERTSHIPIILLTAKAGEESEIEGVKTGADDYITKPFSEDLLKLKVEKRIESLKKLQERYSQEIVLRPKDIAINSTDELFLERVQTVIDTNMVESTFSIDQFCKAVSMSRMQLHRKLKALTGLSTSEFVRSQRLKLAAQLLKNSDINIAQIGYSVGFNDHAYFSKSFKDMYHCTPTEYANNTK